MLEAIISVRIPDFVGDISKRHNAMVKILGCVPFSKTGARSLLEIRASEEKIPGVMKDFKASHGFTEVDMAQTGKDKMLATVSTTKCAICSTMAGSGCFLISAKTKGDFLILWVLLRLFQVSMDWVQNCDSIVWERMRKKKNCVT